MTQRLGTILVATIVCLSALPFVGSAGSTVWAASKTPAVPAVKKQIALEPVAADQFGAQLLPVAQQAGASVEVVQLALRAVECGVASGDIGMPTTLTVIDYSLPSTDPRLWVFDVATGRVLFKELVAHGKGTGENMAEHFSDDMNSHQTSLGLFVTRDTYVGSNGYSLRLDGLEPGFNSRARERAIVMHGAPYVDADFAAKQGRLGRSWGCPALRAAIAHQVIDTVQGGGVIFSYYPDQTWLKRSRFLNCGASAAVATN